MFPQSRNIPRATCATSMVLVAVAMVPCDKLPSHSFLEEKMRTFTKSVLAATLLIGTFAAGTLVRDYVRPGHFEVIALAQANNASEARRCSNRTLQGSYGIKFEGSSLSGGPFVSISLIIFDGAGQFTTTETGRFNGNLVHRTFTGPYTVNPDCTAWTRTAMISCRSSLSSSCRRRLPYGSCFRTPPCAG